MDFRDDATAAAGTIIAVKPLTVQERVQKTVTTILVVPYLRKKNIFCLADDATQAILRGYIRNLRSLRRDGAVITEAEYLEYVVAALSAEENRLNPHNLAKDTLNLRRQQLSNLNHIESAQALFNKENIIEEMVAFVQHSDMVAARNAAYREAAAARAEEAARPEGARQAADGDMLNGMQAADGAMLNEMQAAARVAVEKHAEAMEATRAYLAHRQRQHGVGGAPVYCERQPPMARTSYLQWWIHI
jgi:hypothetical protein